MRSNTAFTIFFTMMLKMTYGSYQVEVRLFNYSNPTGRCCDCPRQNMVRSCCDAFDIFTGPCGGVRGCDSFFLYCLRPLNSTVEGGCANFAKKRSTVNMDDGPINFSQSTVLGLHNPLLLPGLTDAYTGVQLYIEIVDDDTISGQDDDELVDILLINHSLAVGELSPRQPSLGTYGFVTMDLIITVNCAQNFQGLDCTQCVPGSQFTGSYCVPVDDCLDVNCSGNGQCVDGVDSFSCSCDPGFTGELCQTNIDECVGVDCSGNGWCVDGIGNFTCNCSAGYTGTECEVNIDDCVGVDCSGNGECLDGVNSFTCECNPGYTGQFCTSAINEFSSRTLIIIVCASLITIIATISITLILTVGVKLFFSSRQKHHHDRENTIHRGESERFDLRRNELYGISLAPQSVQQSQN